MSEFEHSTTIDASPDEVFDFMSKVENLPKYLPTTHSAQSQGEERVRVQGEAQGHPYDSDGFFRADAASHRIEWGPMKATTRAGCRSRGRTRARA